jgi:hypothetical protein
MLIRSIIASLLLFSGFIVSAQDKYFTKTGKIEFFSRSSMEDIEAKNKSVAVILDSKTGALQFSVLMKGFEFEKALMQEHFNENYVESDKYPKAEFKGTVTNNSGVNYAKDGTYPVKVSGKLTMHGITKDIEAPGTVRIAEGKLAASSTFNIKLSDYKIKIPAVVKDKVSNDIRIAVDCKLEPLKAQ